MTKKILDHELNEVGIYNMILQSSLNDDEMKKKILLKKLKEPAEIKEQLKQMEDVRKQMAPKKSFAEALKENPASQAAAQNQHPRQIILRNQQPVQQFADRQFTGSRHPIRNRKLQY